MFILKNRPSKLALNAFRNRIEIVKAGLKRRDLLKMGLLTSAGFLVAKSGLSSRGYAKGNDNAPPAPPPSPPTTEFVEPLQIMPVKQPVTSLSPAPTAAPNTSAGEGRTRAHQAFAQFPPKKLYTRIAQAASLSMHRELPSQSVWTYDGTLPGPTFVAKYGEPILVRTIN